MRTLPVILGEHRARVLTQGLMVAFYLAVVACVLVGALVVAGLAVSATFAVGPSWLR